MTSGFPYNSTKKRWARLRAFTLMELLVSIAIIAVLAAVLLPVFGAALERSRRSPCSSNLRQLGTAVTAYLGDWDGRYPWAWQNDYVDRGESPALCQVLDRYESDQRLCQCPSDIGETFPRDPFGWKRRTPPIWKMSRAHSSYVYFGVGWAPRPGNMDGRTASSVKKPTQTILLTEIRPWHGPFRFDEMYMSSQGKYNILYCDGHIGRKTVPEWHAELQSEFQP